MRVADENEHAMTAHTTETGDGPEAGTPAAASPVPARRNFSAQVVWTLAVRVFMAGNSVLVGVIVARYLGAEGVGALAVLNVAVAYAVQIGSLGLASANTLFIARDERQLAPAAANALVFGTLGGAALGVLLVWIAAALPHVFGDLPPRLVAVAALSVPFQLITLLGLNIFLAVGRIERFNLLDALGQSMLLVNAVVALSILHAGLWAMISLNTTASIVISIVIVWLTAGHVRRRQPAGRPRTDARLFASMMRFGLKVHAQTVASLLLFRVDLFIVKYFRGAAEAGVYSVASQVALMLMLLPGVIATLLFPRIAAERDERGALACRVTRHTTFVMLVVCLATVPAVFALPLLYGASFADATMQALILLPGVFLVSIAGVLAQHFSGTGLPVALPLFWVAALAVNTALNFALVPAFGPRGAALSSSVSYALVFALITLYFRARTGNRLRTAFVLGGAELRSLLNVGGLVNSSR